MADTARQIHPFPPVYDANSRVLIVGSFPSAESRRIGFYYANPRNRFWSVLASVLADSVPDSTEGRRDYLLRHHIALFDVLESCEIAASSDASIRKAVPNEFGGIFAAADIQHVFANGRAACRYYSELVSPIVEYLPSTSPANAQWSLTRLIDAWQQIIPYLAL